ncbi:MAG: hypothetical protein AAFZ18_04845 [Myxococcota bacterium]
MTDPIDLPTEAESRAYLLGRASEAERARVEEALFEHPEAHHQLRAREEELAEEFLAGELSDREREAFEGRLTGDPKLQESVRLMRSLRAAASPRPARRSWRWVVFAPLAAACLGGLALAVLPRPASELETLTRKGSAEPGEVELRCLPRCELGARLALLVRPPPGRAHLAAFAQDAEGQLIWYEPASGERSRPAAPELEAWPRAFRLDDAHSSGPLQVYVVFSAMGLTRKEVAEAIGEDLKGTPSVALIERRLELAPTSGGAP